MVEAGAGRVSVAFAVDDLPALRRLVDARALSAGLSDRRRGDVVLAVDEIASNAVRHGGGAGTLDLWFAHGWLWFRIVDGGAGLPAGAGRALPEATQANGRGLWIARRVADQFNVDSGPGGTTVTGAFAV
jgi:anti-sigma regulatory factor (Ser/Thr protein kinase)